MQVFAILALVVVSAAAKGSGPYLPSGWRPSGPAFYLPTEVQKPAENLQDVILGSEASGSDALREYGPPKEISVNQGLPDVAIEQNFVDAVSAGEISSVLGRVEESTDIVGIEQTTEAQINVVVVYENERATVAPAEEISERSLNGEILAEINEETTVLPTQEVALEESTAEVNISKVQAVKEELKNLEQVIVPEVLVNIENAVQSEIESSRQGKADSSQESSGPTEQVPEGFLEYGPPGFKEYGPPKEDLNVAAIQGLLGQASVETNEARRRRFSPKFKPVKKLH